MDYVQMGSTFHIIKFHGKTAYDTEIQVKNLKFILAPV